MKKIKAKSDTLLVLCSASFGGPTSSAINLLHIYREQGKTFDVFLMDHNGARTEDIAKEGNILPRISFLADAITNRSNIKSLVQYLHRILFIATHRIFGVKRARKWLYKVAASRLSGKYKNIIAYQESTTSEFARFIDAPNRIAWMHTDFDKLRELSPFYASNEIYDCYHHVASVTKSSADRMIELLNRDPSTIHVIRNPLIPEQIIARSQECVPREEKKKKRFLFVSVGRLSNEKAFDRIPHIAKQLKDSKLNFDWYIIGEGASRDKIESEINKTRTDDVVHLLGPKSNPYPYIRMADVLVITSEYEAQPMVANEALILNTPVISTEFSSVREVINNDNGMIVKKDIRLLAKSIEQFVRDESLFIRLTNGAREFAYSNENEIVKLNRLLRTE